MANLLNSNEEILDLLNFKNEVGSPVIDVEIFKKMKKDLKSHEWLYAK